MHNYVNLYKIGVCNSDYVVHKIIIVNFFVIWLVFRRVVYSGHSRRLLVLHQIWALKVIRVVYQVLKQIHILTPYPLVSSKLSMYVLPCKSIFEVVLEDSYSLFQIIINHCVWNKKVVKESNFSSQSVYLSWRTR